MFVSLLLFILAISIDSMGDTAFSKDMDSALVEDSNSNAFESLEQDIIKTFYNGDLYKLYDSIERLLLSYPTKAESFLYYYDLVRLADIYGYRRVEKTLSELIKAVQNSSALENRDIYLLTLNLELEKLLYSFERRKAELLSKKFYPLRQWQLIGPYNRYGLSDLDYPFMPEITTSLKGAKLPKKKINLKKTESKLRKTY